jgi:hypothetical protein
LKGRRSGKCQSKTFVENNTEKLKNDVILISDTGMISNQQPSITTGLRTELCRSEVTGPNVIYIPVYTVVQLPINQYFSKNDRFALKTIILPFLVL